MKMETTQLIAVSQSQSKTSKQEKSGENWSGDLAA